MSKCGIHYIQPNETDGMTHTGLFVIPSLFCVGKTVIIIGNKIIHALPKKKLPSQHDKMINFTHILLSTPFSTTVIIDTNYYGSLNKFGQNKELFFLQLTFIKCRQNANNEIDGFVCYIRFIFVSFGAVHGIAFKLHQFLHFVEFFIFLVRKSKRFF